LNLNLKGVGVDECFHGMFSKLGCGTNGWVQAVEHWSDVAARADQRRCHGHGRIAVHAMLRLSAGLRQMAECWVRHVFMKSAMKVPKTST
jgi:hypothetical protein